MNRIRSLLPLLLIAALPLLAGCGHQAESKPNGDAAPAEALLAPSDVAVARTTDLLAGLPVSGTLEPSVEVSLTAPFPELVEQVLVREGQPVAKGQVLARMRTTTVAPSAASAEAQLTSAAADYERSKNLFAAGAVAQRDVDAAEAQWRAAQANAAQATKSMRDAVVRAPVAGVISKRHVQSGDRVGDGDPMFNLVNTRELEFAAMVPSEYVGGVRVGAPVRLEVTGFNGIVDGRIARVNASADEATRQVRVYVVVPNPGGRLVGGLFASGKLVTEETRGAVAVPSAAVRGGSGAESFVMAVRGGRLERRVVRAGLRDEKQDLVQLLTGVAPGDTVLVGPIEGLEPGQPARVTGQEG
jgi:RND family efflux transporter MFP subunit